MAERIGLRQIRALQPDQIIWDATIRGFFARRQVGTTVSYGVYYRTVSGRQRFYTLGRHGILTPDSAREEAKKVLGEVARGGDPAADKREKHTAVSVAQLCDQYWQDAASGRLLTKRGRPKQPGTLESDRGRIERHIKPLIGRLSVADVSPRDIEGLLHGIAEGRTARRIATGKPRGLSNVRGGKGVASRTIELLSAIMSYAVDRGLRLDNPCRTVRRFAGNPKERRLSNQEFAKFGQAVRDAASMNVWPPALSAICFLALTGWRSGEVVGLQWSDIDFDRRTATLADTKTGKSLRVLSRAACNVIQGMPRLSERLVFSASRSSNPMSGFRSYFDRIVALAGLDDSEITPHTLRHSFASTAADMEFGEFTIAALLGHRMQSMTSRYVHRADSVLLAAADAVAARVVELMGDAKPEAKSVPIPIRLAVG